MLYQTSNNLGARIFLASDSLVPCLQPEIFLTPTDILTLSSLKGTDVEKVLLKDKSVISYKVINDTIVFESTPAVPALVVPNKNLKLAQLIRNNIPVKLYFQAEPSQEVSGLTISSLDFFTDLPGKIVFSLLKEGPYLESITMAQPTDLWIKGTSLVALNSFSTYITVSGEVYL